MKILLFILLLIATNSYATVNVPTTYSTNGQVTATNLNGNFDYLEGVLNNGLDNTNANTTLGYRFFETKSTLPTAGSQGRVIFLTTDNTLNFDTGSTFNKSVSVNSPANGDILYYNSGWNTLAKGTDGKILKLASGIPSWGLPSDLSITSQAQGDVLYYNGTNWDRLAAGTSGQVLKTQGSSANPVWSYPSGQLGTWDYSSYSADTSYQASTDGFVMAICTVQGNAVKSAAILTDASNPPTHTTASGSSTSSTTALTMTLMSPVKKSHYWKVSNVAGSSVSQIYWIPLGS